MKRTLLQIAGLLTILTCVLVSPRAEASIHRLVVDGAIDPLRTEYVVRGIDQAEAENSRLVVIVLNTPGGLADAMETMIQRVLASRVPVAVFVAPSGGRAASAGFFLLLSADVAAMAPGTRTGAAHPILSIGGLFPVDPGGSPSRPQSPPAPAPEGTPESPAPAPTPQTQPGGTGSQASVLMEKISNDIQAFLRAIAEHRGRNPKAAVEAVTESRSWSDSEALEAGLIDLVALNEADLLLKLDGREIRRLDGSTVTLSTKDAPIVTIEMTFRERVLSFLVNPNVAFLLLLVGGLLVYIEVTQPGMVIPGVVGGLFLLLAVTGFSFLPVTATGVILIIAAVGLFVAEAFVQSFGMLALAGVVSLAIGGIMLVDIPEGGVRVDPGLAIGAALGFGIIAVVIMKLAVGALRAKVSTGSEGMIGLQGKALSDIGESGNVEVMGEYWKARAEIPVPKGSAIRVVGMDGLVLSVEVADDESADLVDTV
jgi:membrane-bound serine protease (ClpP class)